MSEMRCMQLAGSTGCQKLPKKLPFGHHHTTLSGCVFATKACIDTTTHNHNHFTAFFQDHPGEPVPE